MLQPQDILILLKLSCVANRGLNNNVLAQSLGINPSEVGLSLIRCSAAQLYDPILSRIRTLTLKEFLIYGLPHVFYAEVGSVTKGIPTAHSAEPLKNKLIVAQNDVYVWPDPEGTDWGLSIEPLYGSVPLAIKFDLKLYYFLTVIDALRVGRTREKQLAVRELELMLSNL